MKTGDGCRMRHKEMISISKPEAQSLMRASCMNKTAISKYFGVLKTEIKKLGISDKPWCI